MDSAKVCRLCLVTGIKFYSLETFPFNSFIENMIGMLISPELPLYICIHCATLTKKYQRFQQSCAQNQLILYSILHKSGNILQEIKQLNLPPKLQTYFITEENIYNLNHEEQIEIKDEPLLYGYDFKTDIVKDEGSIDIDYGNDNFNINSLSSDDDEPLSLHKSKKKDKKVKKKRKKSNGKVELVAVDKNRLEDEVTELPTEFTAELAEPKKKRGRPKKTGPSKVRARRTRNTGGVIVDDIALEEYVSIIKLSVEEQMEEITKRQQSSNYLNAPFQCNLCYKGFIDTHAWKHHVGKHDPSAGDIECPICKFRFKTKRTLQKHASNHEKKYACKACSYVSKTTTQAKQHQRWHKGVTYKCQYCDEVSTKWTSYLSHVRIKHPSEFICGICGYSFVSKLGLTMHKTMMHKDVVEKTKGASGAEGPYCTQCDVQFISEEVYKRHMVTSVKHTQSNDFTTGCRVCGETFTTPEDLRLHHRKEHARKRPKNYGKKPSGVDWPARCEHCPEEIASARDYWSHFRRAHPDKSYPIQKNHTCDVCGKSFRGNAFLVYHKRTHSTERTFKCAQCPKAFFNRTNLYMHEKTHSDSRPYPCDVCFKAFKCKGALDRHYRSHTGVKPYECEVCGKAFGQSNSRKLHVRTVHLKQPAPYVSRSRLERRRHAPPREQPPTQFMY